MTPGLPVHHQLPEFTQTHVHWVRDAIQPSHPLSSPSPPAPNPSQHQGLSNESVLYIRWPKCWSFSFSPSSEYSGLISFRNDWLDLLAVQETLKSLLQCHSSKGSILYHKVAKLLIKNCSLQKHFKGTCGMDTQIGMSSFCNPWWTELQWLLVTQKEPPGHQVLLEEEDNIIGKAVSPPSTSQTWIW